jgi:hypothetical protein
LISLFLLQGFHNASSGDYTKREFAGSAFCFVCPFFKRALYYYRTARR